MIGPGEMMESHSSKLPVAFALIVIVMFFLLALDPALAQAEPEDAVEELPMGVLVGEQPPPQNTPYYVRTTTGNAVASGSLSPKGLEANDSLAEITVPGPTFPKRTLTRAGRFTMQISVGMDLEVLAISHVTVWAKSAEDVQGARFRFLFMRGGNTITDMSTNMASMTNMPQEFTVSSPDPFVEPQIFRQGERMELEIQYTANSRRVIGPAPGCTVLTSNNAHPTRIELLTRPLEMNVSTPMFTEGHVHIQGKVIDTSELDAKSELKINLDIITPSGTIVASNLIEQMNLQYKEVSGENIINWTWDYKRMDVLDGLFELRIDVSYGVIGHNYTNSSYEEIEFPKEKESGGFQLTSQNMMIIGAIAGVALVVVVLALRMSGSRYPGPYPGRGPPRPRPRKGKKPKLSKAEKRARKKGKGAPPPPAGPRPPQPGRTPMPGRAPPGARGPPSRVPRGQQGAGAAKVGTPRPRR
jgi:hypothetical protein